MNPILTVKDLSVAFDGESILKDVSFEVEEGQTLMILGPNGAGKTVLLRALLGLLPYQGEVVWRKGTKIGYVPQRVPFNKDIPLTIADFFELKRVSQKETATALKWVGVKDDTFLKKHIGMISSGQFQRVLIAWALVDNPVVLLFDEPTAGIDIGGEETVYDLLRRTQKERALTILLVTHELTAVYNRATQVLCLNKKMVCYGSPREILSPQILQDMFGGEIKYYVHTHE